MYAEVLLVFVLVLRFETYMMVPMKETSPTTEEPTSAYLNDGKIRNIAPQRCGVCDEEIDIEDDIMVKTKDIDIEDNDIESRRRKRYVDLPPTPGPQFNCTTYKVILDSSHSPGWFKEVAVMNVIREAFEYWARESPLQFTYQPSGEVDITIMFTSKQVCGYGALGCSLIEPMGKVYLGINEGWTINDFEGTNMFQVATHEIGHLLGLDHSRDDASVMQVTYPGNRKYFRTAPNDIRAIRNLYGSRKGREIIDEKSPVYMTLE